MSKVGRILFWVFFPLSSLLLTALLLFYLDLANGPLIIMIIECVLIVGAIVATIVLRNHKKRFKIIPLLSLILASAIMFVFAKPAVETRQAARYQNAVATEVKEIRDGKIKGVYNEDKSVEIYAGIPYAKAPVGELRWKAPVDPNKWNDVKDCSIFAPRAMQVDTNPVIQSLVDIYGSKGYFPDFNMHPLQNMSEDCLYLNVWKPNTNETNLPILIYIHGGSLTGGSSAYENYNGEEMAKTGVIMVTIAYRLGIFGYLAQNQLFDECDPSSRTTGNYGLLDQIKALEWVKSNATYFGGNPNNITIAGESAGSSSVSALCCSPLAKGLFNRAIGESSSIVVKNPPHTYRDLNVALEMGDNILKEFNCKTIDELRKLPAEQLINTKYTNSSMTLDGYALTKTPYQTYLDHENNEESLLNGYNVDEGDAFVIPQFLLSPTNENNILERLITQFGDEWGKKIYDFYLEDIKKDAFSTMNEIFSVYWFMHPHHSWMEAARNNGVNIYRYQFKKDNHFISSYHAGEIIYAYGNVKNDTTYYRFNQGDVELSNKMHLYWSNFAKNGNPNGSGLPTWNLYNDDTTKIHLLSDQITQISDKNVAAFQLFDEYNDYLESKKA